jgi:hypothetical protein
MMCGAMATCTHLDHVHLRELPEAVDGCADCLAVGGRWLHLRICLECGHVACCDDSPARHATAHFHGTGHPVMRSIEPGEHWSWCYVDETPVHGVGLRGEPRIPPSPMGG